MIISLIAAMSKNGVIGDDNKLPWHIPQELQHFKKTTRGKPIVMGRKTFASLNNQALPQRKNIIISKNLCFEAEHCVVVHSVDEAINEAGDCPELMVIGGAEIFKLFLPVADKIYLSIINKEVSGDTYFPEIDSSEWKLVSDEKHEEFRVLVYERDKALSL